MGKMQRRKGHQYEREIAKKFRQHGFNSAKRHLEYQSKECNGIDLDGTYPFLVQCKRGKKYASINAIFEIKEDINNDGFIPLLVTKADRHPDMVVLPFADFLQLIKKHGIKFVD